MTDSAFKYMYFNPIATEHHMGEIVAPTVELFDKTESAIKEAEKDMGEKPEDLYLYKVPPVLLNINLLSNDQWIAVVVMPSGCEYIFSDVPINTWGLTRCDKKDKDTDWE